MAEPTLAEYLQGRGTNRRPPDDVTYGPFGERYEIEYVRPPTIMGYDPASFLAMRTPIGMLARATGAGVGAGLASAATTFQPPQGSISDSVNFEIERRNARRRIGMRPRAPDYPFEIIHGPNGEQY